MTQAYEREYFNDNYKAHFESLRSTFGERSRKALKERAIDHAPVPNATTIVFLHKDPNGGEHITTDDFVAYFNSHYGGSDRIGMMCRTLDYAERKAELREKAAARQVKGASRKTKPRVTMPLRSAGRRPVLANLFFVCLFCLSMFMLFGSAAVVDNTVSEVAALEAEVAVLEAEARENAVLQAELPAYNAPAASFNTLSGEDSVEIYQVEEKSGFTAALLDALGFLGNK